MELGIQQKLQHKMNLSVQLVQSIEILQLPALELSTIIKQELEDNPTLEVLEEKTSQSDEKTDDKPEEKSSADRETVEKAEPSTMEILDETRDRPEPERPAFIRGGDDKKMDAFQNAPAKSVTLQDYLYQQFMMMEISDEVKKIGENIIYNIDHNGYFQASLEEIVRTTGVSLEQGESVLKLVQKLDPSGVGARNLAECLLLQLQEDDPNLELKKVLITRHLDNIKLNKLPVIAKELNLDIEEIKIAVQEIIGLNPHPGADFSSEKVPYVLPEIIVDKVDGHYEIRVDDSYIPRLSISAYYRSITKDKESSAKVKEFIRNKIISAKRLIAAIQLRQTTIYRIAEEIVSVQKEFLDQGLAYLKPLQMKEVARQLSLHVSTISRAISNKYMQTPRGIFSLKFFFSRPGDSSVGETRTHNRVMELIKKMVDNEDKKNPLSDEIIVDELKKEGFGLARRTIAKYRKVLRISSSMGRKQY